MERKDYGEIKSPVKAIKTFCVEECNCGNYTYAKNCVDNKCPLYPFRLGKNPYRKGREFTEEEKEKLRERMAAMRTSAGAQD